MPWNYKYDYLQAKLHGIHSKSIQGSRLKQLSRIRNIEKLLLSLFPGTQADIMQQAMYTYIEKKMQQKINRQIQYVADYFENRHPVINALVFSYEIENAKTILRAHLTGEKKISSSLTKTNLPNAVDYELASRCDTREIAKI